MPNQQACRCEPIIQRLPRRGPLRMGTSAFLGRSRKGERITVPQKLLVRNSASSIFYTRHSSCMAIDNATWGYPQVSTNRLRPALSDHESETVQQSWVP